MNKKLDWPEYKQVLESWKIKKLYHFTDIGNIESIIQNGGLYSWMDCDEKGIKIAKLSSSEVSRSLDLRDGLEYYVRLSFVPDHPMMYVAKNEGRISNPMVLEIDTDVALWKDTLYSDRNATKNGSNVGGMIDNFKTIHFGLFNNCNYFELSDDEKMYYQAEVMVKHFIPLKYITNIYNLRNAIPGKQKNLCRVISRRTVAEFKTYCHSQKFVVGKTNRGNPAFVCGGILGSVASNVNFEKPLIVSEIEKITEDGKIIKFYLLQNDMSLQNEMFLEL